MIQQFYSKQILKLHNKRYVGSTWGKKDTKLDLILICCFLFVLVAFCISLVIDYQKKSDRSDVMEKHQLPICQNIL